MTASPSPTSSCASDQRTGEGCAPVSRAFRGSLLDFSDDPARAGASAVRHVEDGLLLVQDGHIVQRGPACELLPQLPAGTVLTDYSGHILCPGFVDTHVHYAQTDIIASHGEQLLAWLEKYTFPTERRFADPAHAAEVARFFIHELLRNGTTTALAFATVHPASVDAIFSAAQAHRMRLIAGKVLMDRHCPEFLRDSPQLAHDESTALIRRWHGHDRLLYAVTPRFAPTSTDAQMEVAGALYREHAGVYLQSHVAENPGEVAWVRELYPSARSYLDVYERFGHLGPRSMFAHCIWLDRTDRERMAATGSAMSFCPTSNLFLGSGLFDWHQAQELGVKVSIGTDVGGGTSFSMLQTLAEAYKVLQLKGQSLSAEQAFYLATLGGARALELDDRIGSFEIGREADFVVLDRAATPLMARRMACAETLSEQLFVLMMLGDDRCIAATHVLGEAAYQRAPS